jgi:hypothetical protein
MLKNKNLLLLLSSGMLFGFAQPVNALSGLSRACRVGDFPTGSKNIAAQFFVALGADPTNVNLPDAPDSVQRTRYILESITTDYGRVRYFLYATSAQYYKADTYLGPLWYNFRTMKTTWTAQQVSDAVKVHPTFQPFFYNRGLLYSARAGASGIIEEFKGPWQFKVRGRHYFYDPATKVATELQPSSATDCNLTNWGVELFDR